MFFISKPTLFMNVKDFSRQDHPLHLHNYLEIIHITSGKISMQVGTKTYDAYPGDIIYISPNVPHCYTSHPEEEPPKMRVISSCVDVFPLLRKDIEKIPLFPVLRSFQVHPDVLYAENRLFELDSRQENAVFFSSFTSLILGHILPLMGLKSPEETDDLVSGVVTYLANHYLEQLSLETVARRFGVNTFKLSRIFSNDLGISFKESINSLRISHACYLLLSTDASITFIAAECGYNNQQTFNRVFKEQNLCTPKEYRKTHSFSEKYSEIELTFPNSHL